MSMPLPFSVFVECKTWSRDSHGLFDYESHSMNRSVLELSSPCVLLRIDSSIEQVPSCAEQDSAILNVSSEQGSMYLSSASPEQLWFIVKYLATGDSLGHSLATGDIIKLGRVQMRVRELKGLDCADLGEATQDSSEDESDLQITCENEPRQCRICLCQGSEELNPLVAPCNCLGSIKYLHLKCLQSWMEARKVRRESENSVNFYWKDMHCELCKTPFDVKAEGKRYDLISMNKPAKPYLVLETMNRDSSYGVHVISLTNKFHVKLGRGHDSDIRISDISVSRVHASIQYKDSQFVLSDNSSKFGSLLLARERVLVLPGKPLHLQVGRTAVQIECEGAVANSNE